MTSRQGAISAGKRTAWPAVVLVLVTVVWTAAMAASLKWRFLDPFVAGARHGKIGDDFFQVPRGYLNLLAGNSIFLTEMSDYGPFGSMYLNHPFFAVAIGPWFAALTPWTAYGAFVAVSLGLLLTSGWLMASVFEGPAQRAFAYCVMFCSLPTYLLLWAGQVHVFLILAVTLILAGVMRIEQDPTSQPSHGRWIQLGLLLSLLSKPIVLLMLPVLLCTAETRRKLLLPVAVYAVASLSFLLVDGLNPGGYNGIHWLNITRASSSAAQWLWIASPIKYDVLKDFGLYSLPVFLDRTLGGQAVLTALYKLPLVVILAMSAAPLMVRDRSRRLRLTVVTLALCAVAHFLSYYPVQEYHYTTALLVLPVLLWLRQRESASWLRGLLLASFLISLAEFLPTGNFLMPRAPARYWVLGTLLRVAPMAVAFVGLTVYGAAVAWLARPKLASGRGPASLAQQEPSPALPGSRRINELGAILASGGALAIMLAAVAAAAYATVPARFLTSPSRWTAADWSVHDQAMRACCDRALARNPQSAEAHTQLAGILYRQGKTNEAVSHLCTAVAANPDSSVFRSLGVIYLNLGQDDQAEKVFRKALALYPNDPGSHSYLGVILMKRGRQAEALEHYRQALAISPDFDERIKHLEAVLTLQEKEKGHHGP